MVFDGNTGWTRKGKFYKDEVMRHLMFGTHGLILDGELMLPPDVEFEKLKTATSNYIEGLTSELMYYVFDVIPEEDDTQFQGHGGVAAPYSERYAVLEELFETVSVPENVYLLPSVTCQGPEDAEERLGKALARGYEGLMLRNMDGKYDIGHRSYDLQKLKLFHDSEFEIVGCVEGKGSDSGAIIYVCRAKGGEFTVRPKQTLIERQRLWEDLCEGSYDPVGQMLTVEYFELTAKGMPRFPKGKGIRDVNR
jgi:DNA ligase-1